ncbi:MAG: tetratricopeptide repeat protein [Gammaproteobacteria bacterium]
MSFFAELQRRNVFRAGIAYAITAWLIAQIAGLAADSFGAPDWVMKMIITILILGFPIAMVMAWAYEMTPEGLRRDDGDAPSPSSTSKLDRTIIIALVAALAYFAYDKFVLGPQREAALLESAGIQVVAPPGQAGEIPAPVTETPPSIAVLPFVNMSTDEENEYFSEGLSEELLNLLVKIPELQVAARTSSFSYKGKDTKIAQIGEELNVAHVLEGSVRKSGNQVRITAQLIKADDGYHLWSETFDRTLDDIFAIQDEISAAVVQSLKITLLGGTPEHKTTSPEAYALYLQGKYLITLPASDEELEMAISAFKEALAIDPEYAPAWVGLSWAYEYQRFPAIEHSYEEQVALIRDAAARGLALDPNLALAWSTTSYLKRKYEWDWQGANEAAEKALQLEPNNFDVLLGVGSVKSSLGQLEDSIKLFERALELNPLGLEALGSLAYRYTMSGHYEESVEIYNRLLAMVPDNHMSHYAISEIYMLQGDHESALAEIEKVPDSHRATNFKAGILFAMGKEAEATALVSEFLNTPPQTNPYPKALIHIWFEEFDLAFEYLEYAFEQHHSGLTHILVSPTYAPLRNDPRYRVLVEKMGLLEYWEAMQ